MPEPSAALRPLDKAACREAQLVDLGCGLGQSLERDAGRFGVRRAIGIDHNRAKVTQAQADGRAVYHGQARSLDPADFPACEVVMFNNVLEHVGRLEGVERLLGRAFELASRVVYVRHPSFQHKDYLAELGCKQYWTDWPGAHTAPVQLDEFTAMAARMGVYRCTTIPVKRAVSSEDDTILPLSAAPNAQRYDADAHGPKPHVVFDRPVYFAFDIFFWMTTDVGALQYPGDPEVDPTRPSVVWGTSDQPRA